MIKFLFALFFAMFVYGLVSGQVVIGLCCLFCGLCLCYFSNKMTVREAAWRASPEGAVAPPPTDEMLDRYASECSCRICHPKF